MSTLDEMGRIHRDITPEPREVNVEIYPINPKVSERIEKIISSLGLPNNVVAVGCYAPLEAEGITFEYFDCYPSVGEDGLIQNLGGINQGVIYIESDYGSELTLSDNLIVITNNQRGPDISRKRRLLGVLKNMDLITDEKNLQPYRDNLAKTPQEIEEEGDNLKKNLLAKLSGNSAVSPEKKIISGEEWYVFGKVEK